jgi:ABC-type transport system involved in multi-copper enzyme maturation permease subunit
LFLLLGLVGFLPLLSSFKLLSREWSHNTVYLVMSLPVSGAMILGSKMMVLLTQYIVGTLLIGLSGSLLYATKLFQFFAPYQPDLAMLANHPELISNFVAFYLAGLAFLVFSMLHQFL